MRVNVYAEEITGRVQIISKEIDGTTFTGLRFYLELPVTRTTHSIGPEADGTTQVEQIRGPFIHHPGDDDSAAVTFWGKHDLRHVLQFAIDKLDKHYAKKQKEDMDRVRGYRDDNR